MNISFFCYFFCASDFNTRDEDLEIKIYKRSNDKLKLRAFFTRFFSHRLLIIRETRDILKFKSISHLFHRTIKGIARGKKLIEISNGKTMKYEQKLSSTLVPTISIA